MSRPRSFSEDREYKPRLQHKPPLNQTRNNIYNTSAQSNSQHADNTTVDNREIPSLPPTPPKIKPNRALLLTTINPDAETNLGTSYDSTQHNNTDAYRDISLTFINNDKSTITTPKDSPFPYHQLPFHPIVKPKKPKEEKERQKTHRPSSSLTNFKFKSASYNELQSLQYSETRRKHLYGGERSPEGKRRPDPMTGSPKLEPLNPMDRQEALCFQVADLLKSKQSSKYDFQQILDMVKEHIDLFDEETKEKYILLTSPETVIKHLKLMRRSRTSRDRVSILVERLKKIGDSQTKWSITISSADRSGFLQIVTHVLSSIPSDILRADISTTQDHIVLDHFIVACENRISAEAIANTVETLLFESHQLRVEHLAPPENSEIDSYISRPIHVNTDNYMQNNNEVNLKREINDQNNNNKERVSSSLSNDLNNEEWTDEMRSPLDGIQTKISNVPKSPKTTGTQITHQPQSPLTISTRNAPSSSKSISPTGSPKKRIEPSFLSPQDLTFHKELGRGRLTRVFLASYGKHQFAVKIFDLYKDEDESSSRSRSRSRSKSKSKGRSGSLGNEEGSASKVENDSNTEYSSGNSNGDSNKRTREEVLKKRDDMITEEINREINMVKGLKHPNICRFYGILTSTCLVFEYMPGGSLMDFIKRCAKRKREIDIIKVGLDISQGMEFVHQQRIIHRDLKPQNILIDKHGTMKVADFGLSKIIQTAGEEMTGATGSYRYMAPECIRSESYSYPADVYSFGLTLWSCLTLQVPFSDLSPLQTAFAVAHTTARPPLPENISSQHEMIITRCWDEDPSKRPSFSELREIFELLSANR